eukprot:3652767-Amphidinium_carterae.1
MFAVKWCLRGNTLQFISIRIVAGAEEQCEGSRAVGYAINWVSQVRAAARWPMLQTPKSGKNLAACVPQLSTDPMLLQPPEAPNRPPKEVSPSCKSR